MRLFYGEKNFLRALDETEFWKHQEAEHTSVIRQIVPNLEMEYVNLLENWEQAFSQAQAQAVRFIETIIRGGNYISPELKQDILQFLAFALSQSQNWVNFLNLLVSNSQAVKTNPTAIVVINHIRRESEYFIGILQVIVR